MPVTRALVLLLIGGVAVYLAAAAAADSDAVFRAARRLDVLGWAAILALSLANYALRFVRWRLYLRGIGRGLTWMRHMWVYFAGFALTATPAKSGETMRALYLKPYGVGYGRCLAAVYAERLLDVLVMSLLAALIVFAPVSGFRWLAALGIAIAVGLIVLQHSVAVTAARALAERFTRGRISAALRHAATFIGEATAMVRPRMLTAGVAIGVVAWLAEGAELYIVAQALGVDLTATAAIAIYAVAMLGGALSFVPGGLGGTEAIMVSLLALSGAPLPEAVAITGIVRVATLWFAIALGIGAWFGIAAFPSRLAAESGATSN